MYNRKTCTTKKIDKAKFMKLYGLIGKSLGHSFSALYFNEKFKKEGITNSLYKLYQLNFIDEIVSLLKNNKKIYGLNVTIPYKQNIIPFLDEIDIAAKEIGAVNTIKINYCNNKTYLKGYNTDCSGFIRSIKPFLNDSKINALVLGTGGSSKAVQYALKELGIEFCLVSRKKTSEKQFLYKELTKTILDSHRLIINTTPLGMFPNIDESPDIPYQFITAKHLLYDLIYNPKQTAFLKQGIKHNAQIINGLEMLKFQADDSWKIWTSK